MVFHRVNGVCQDVFHGVGQIQAAVLDGGHVVGRVGHGQVTGAHGKLDVIFRLGEPLEECDTGGFFLRGALGHHHAGALLDSHLFAPGKRGVWQHFQADLVALGVAHLYLLGEKGGAGVGAHIGQHIAGLDVVTAETALARKPALDKGNIVVLPQLPGHILGQVHGHLAVFHGKEGAAQILGTNEHVVCHGVAAKQRLAVVRNFRPGVGPVVVFFGGGYKALHGGKVLIRCPCGRRKGLPIGIIEEQQLGGFCHRENFDGAVVVKVTLGEIALRERRFFLVGQVAAQVRHKAHLVHGIAGVGIRGEDIGHLCSPHLALGCGQHIGLQIVDAALAGSFHRDVLLLAHRGVELIHQLAECFQLVAVVVAPYRNGHRLGVRRCRVFRSGHRAAPAGSQAQRQCRGAGQCSDSFEKTLHSDVLTISRGFHTRAPLYP